MNPIAYTPLTSVDEIFKFSYRTTHTSDLSTVRWQNNGQIAFTDANCQVWVTPYRPEIHKILEDAGYREYGIFVPFSNPGPIPKEYENLKKMADDACYAYTYEKAKKIADSKGIKAVEINQKVHVRQISYFMDESTKKAFSEMATKFLFNQSSDNIGTYVVVDQKRLLVCDEYSRTYLITVNNAINDIVNTLIKAGYKQAAHPEWYVHDIRN